MRITERWAISATRANRFGAFPAGRNIFLYAWTGKAVRWLVRLCAGPSYAGDLAAQARMDAADFFVLGAPRRQGRILQYFISMRAAGAFAGRAGRETIFARMQGESLWI
jgi:hypothetical protein